MNRILVPTDFSSTAERAFRFAADIASKTSGTIILYHVDQKEEIPFFDSVEKRNEYNQQIETNRVKQLKRLKKKVISEDMNVPVSTIVGRPPVVRDILRFAMHNQIELIVMGTQGASGLEKIVVGSVASQVIEKSPIPVLLIPEKFEWKDPEHIVFATNYDRKDRDALEFTLSLAKIYNADVTVVHLTHEGSLLRKEDELDFNTYAYALQRTFSDSELNFKEIKTTRLNDTMENLHDELAYDMLVMVRHTKKFLEKFLLKSFTKNMACITTLPLLIVPEEE